jgi:hypothetical protein
MFLVWVLVAMSYYVRAEIIKRKLFRDIDASAEKHIAEMRKSWKPVAQQLYDRRLSPETWQGLCVANSPNPFAIGRGAQNIWSPSNPWLFGYNIQP